MNWKLRFTTVAQREIGRLDPPVREQLQKDLELLAESPLEGKMLHGRFKGVRSWRSGDYRILYNVLPEAEELVIYRIANRREAYR